MAWEPRPGAGEAWEEHVEDLLQCRYKARPPGFLQNVPSELRGDLGIDSFAQDGNAYQCYAPEVALSPAQEFEHFRRKMTADLSKFVENRDELVALFGPLRIEQWVFVVPTLRNRQIIEHANQKADEIKRRDLPYVAEGFRISIVDEKSFAPEQAELAQAGLAVVSIDVEPPAHPALADWAIENDEMIRTLERKMRKVNDLGEDERKEFQLEVLRGHLVAENMLQRLRVRAFNIFQQVEKVRETHSRSLARTRILSDASPRETIEATISHQEELLAAQTRGLEAGARSELAFGAVAKWLLECPLDFKERRP